MQVASVNVRTLAPRVDVILGWGFDILVLSEVRVALPAIRSLSRYFRAKGCDAVFGTPPPPSPTFTVRPGGLAVITKLPRAVRKVHPPELSHWEGQGRVLVADVMEYSAHIYVLAIYGFAPSHEEHATNDSLLTECFAWAGRQRVCVLVTGDMNETVYSSVALASVTEHNLRRISPDMPSTAGKWSALSKGHPIDHAVVNLPLWDSLLESRFRYDLPLADHYPLVSSFLSPSSLPPSVWLWPKPCREFPNAPVCENVPFLDSAHTFAEWSEQARRWLQDSYSVTIEPKTSLKTSNHTSYLSSPPPLYTKLIKTVRSILHLQKLESPHWGQVRALHEKLAKLEMEWNGHHDTLEPLLMEVKRRMNEVIKKTCMIKC